MGPFFIQSAKNEKYVAQIHVHVFGVVQIDNLRRLEVKGMCPLIGEIIKTH